MISYVERANMSRMEKFKELRESLKLEYETQKKLEEQIISENIRLKEENQKIRTLIGANERHSRHKKVRIEKDDDYHVNYYYCPSCSMELEDCRLFDNFCFNCGQALDWGKKW